MTDVSTWSQVDGSNTSTAPAGAPEGMAPSAVNDVLRAVMGSVAREQAHINATATSTGSADTQVLTYTVAPSAYFTGQRFCFKAGYTNATTTPTLNVNSLGAKTIVQADGSTALRASQITAGTVYEVSYDGTNFRLISGGSFAGPTSSTDNDFALFNGTSGQVVKDAGFSTIPVTKGGTGQTTLTDKALLVGAGTSVVGFLTPSSSSMVPTSDGTTFAMAYPKVLQTSYTTVATTSNIATIIPADDTIPQNTEGTQLITATITPISASSKIRIRGVVFGSVNTGAYLCAALFKDSNASASYATWQYTNSITTMPFEFQESSGSTSARTYKIRIGTDNGTTIRVNGDTVGNRLGGGVANCYLIIDEVN